MLRLLKQEIATQYQQTVLMPRGADIVGVSVSDHDGGVVTVWYRADDEEDMVLRYLYLAAENDPADLLLGLPAWGPVKVGVKTLVLFDDGEPAEEVP